MKEKKFLKKLKSPSGGVLVLLYLSTAAVCGASIVAASVGGRVFRVVGYALYVLAAVLLAYSGYTVVKYATKVKGRVVALLKKRALTARILEQYGFRTVFFAGFSLVLSAAYVLFNGVIAIASHSVWYGALAGYYLLLTGLRGGVVFCHRRKAKKGFDDETEEKLSDARKYRNSGILLMILPLALSFAILQMVVSGSAFVHWGWTVYAFAAYAFYKIVMSSVNVVKAKRTDDLTVQALRNVGLADSLVTILALQTSLLYAFYDGNGGFANALTGGVVCALTLVIGAIMIVKGNKRIKLLKLCQTAAEKERELAFSAEALTAEINDGEYGYERKEI